jgi:protein arginine N-methyltransferase 1
VYTLAAYGRMIRDRLRIDAYHRALAGAIGPESVVLDIGAGTGIMSLLACRLGARRVIAVDPSAAIHVAGEMAAANGCRDRLEVVQGLSTGLELAERADVIVSDLRGILPFERQHIPSVIDARARLLAPGGVLIPRADTLWAAPADAPDVYGEFMTPWTEGACGLDLQRAGSLAVNTWIKARVAPGQLLAAPQRWVTIDYEQVAGPSAHGEMCFRVERAGTAHGIAVWFDADLGSGVTFSNAPGQPELIYGQAFFPLTAPVTVDRGDSIAIELHANLVGDDYVWRWFTRVYEQDVSDRVTAEYRQSTFLGQPLPAASLRKRAATFVPRPKAEAAVDGLILSLMDGKASSGEIARTVMASFPSRFRSWEDALACVGRVALEYSE